ncbi:MAG TPA: TPM domain-containing protein [candidate division Zixibacteria bacterium]|nr:TPM domain-containing protein [candidate division Zixibacteria bacterium]
MIGAFRSAIRSRRLRLACLLAAAISPCAAAALEVPPLRGRVNDLAGMLPPERIARLEQRLAAFESETGHQVAVLTIPSLEGDDLESFSIRVAESWKIGQKGFDNGAILLVARDDRKLRIEVGYGLEGVIPDAIASRIVRETIVPRFRRNDFAGGIEAGVEEILRAARGEKLPDAPRRSAPENGSAWAPLLFLLLIPTYLASHLVARRRRRAPLVGALSGAVLGGLGAGLALGSGAGFSLALLVFLVLAAVAIGIAGGLHNELEGWETFGRRRRGRWSGPFYSDTFGPGWSGGDFGGGGSTGGFSGGGGGFGGGGASGSW